MGTNVSKFSKQGFITSGACTFALIGTAKKSRLIPKWVLFGLEELETLAKSEFLLKTKKITKEKTVPKSMANSSKIFGFC
jgi:hypothetical protein